MEPSAQGDSRQANVSGEGLDSAAPKPPQGPKKGPAVPKTAPTKAVAKIRPKAAAAKKAPKAEKVEGAEGEAKPGRQESPPVDEPGSSRASLPQPLKPPTEVLQTATQSQSPGGAREELSEPQLSMKEDNELPSVSTPLPQDRDGEPAPKRAKPTTAAPSTPSAAGVRPKETQEPEISPQMRLIISQAIAQGIAAGIQQKQQAASSAPTNQGQSIASDNSRDLPVPQRPHCPASSIHTPESLWGDEEQKELMVSEDGVAPNRPAFTGLFNPALFKTLLYKAKTTAGVGADADTSLDLSDPNILVFSEPAIDKEEIPTPKLFLDVVQRQWAQTSVHHAASGREKQLYNVALNLTEVLQVPKIDRPVVALASPTFVSNDTDDALGGEDRKAEVTLRKSHQVASWAVKSSLSASFFNRTSLLWLKEMQARIPATDLRTHQDIKKLVAAAEFSADATLNSAKFASRAIASSVIARRLLWLRHWQADMKFKWKLASSPYKGDKLFGDALEPLLVETKDKKKVLPHSDRKPYFERPGFRGRGRQQFQSNRPFRGNGTRPSK
ncbi:titin-like [Erythrolamprus reginae]|uniref:titin-like n=1 Tax=Erythrolamprus reginae TaxID=121349 RepID=UPI00396C5C3C